MSRRTSRRVAAGALVSGLLALAACADNSPGGTDEDDLGITTVTFRVWDDAAASAYRESFDAFTAAHRDILVDVEVVPWESYWLELETDLDAGTGPDVFWTNTANVERYAAAGQLVSITEALGDAHAQWQPAVVDLYTHDDQLWGVPQLWDAIVLYYNTELVQTAGVDPDSLNWLPAPADGADGTGVESTPPTDPATTDDDAAAAAAAPTEAPRDAAVPAPTDPAPVADDEAADDEVVDDEVVADEAAAEGTPGPQPTDARDTLLPAARSLTVDAEGRTAADEGFDPERIVQYGFNAEPHLQAVLLPFLAQAGATFQSEGVFAFDSAEGLAAIGYLSDLVNVHHVAPPVDPRGTPDAGLKTFIDGRLALFQSGPYHLRRIAESADFEWGIARVVAGPQGPVSLVHGVVAAARGNTSHDEAVAEVLDWVGSVDGQLALASQGVALPGAVEAQDAFLDYWERAGVDVSPFLDAAAGPLTPPPSGPAVQAGIEAVLPILATAIAGERPVEGAVAVAQVAGNRALDAQTAG